MTIEHELKRIADALENSAKPAPVQTITEERTLEPEPEPEHVPTFEEMRAAVLQLAIGERENEARALMEEFGVQKIDQFKPEQYEEVINKFNAVFHS